MAKISIYPFITPGRQLLTSEVDKVKFWSEVSWIVCFMVRYYILGLSETDGQMKRRTEKAKAMEDSVALSALQ